MASTTVASTATSSSSSASSTTRSTASTTYTMPSSSSSSSSSPPSRHHYNLSMDDLNKTALDQFIYQPVSRDMIAYLADAAHNVIICDSAVMPPQKAESTGRDVDAGLPTLEEFITQLVVSSNVQVATLMSTLVYLTRLRSKLQPMARGLRCTTHRIFLASLILAAKYLNDSSPKNKHWANYTHINTDEYNFGFNRTEVNLMEKQLLFLLEWDLRITEQDLYTEFDAFLEPLRQRIADRHARRMRHREEKRRQQDVYAVATMGCYPSPPASRGHSRSRQTTPESLRAATGGNVTPPGLTYSSSASSYASSIASSHQQSRSTTPLESDPSPYLYTASASASASSLYSSPVEVVLDADVPKAPGSAGRSMLPYEISADQYHRLHDGPGKKRQRRGVWGRLLGGTVAVR